MSPTSTTDRPPLPALTQFTATTWAAASSDPSRAPYKVERRRDGSLACTCAGSALWGKICRHIKAVEAGYPSPVAGLSWDDRRAAAPHASMCAACGQIRAADGGLLCPRCARNREIAAPAPAPIRRTGTAGRLEDAVRASAADSRQAARDRDALELAASCRPIGR